MIRFITQRLRRVKVKPWKLVLIAFIVWGYVVTQWIHDTKFLAGFWGLTNDEIAVVTIEKSEDTSTETIIIQDPSKSFWDGLQLLGVPLALAILGAWFQQSQRKQDADDAKEEVLQLYFDRISTLLIDKNLMAIASKGNDVSSESKELLEASLDIIRARTLSILRRFEKDIERKSSVIRFLAEAEIISKLGLNLSSANLERANLKGANLERANLKGANLERANLKGANLEKANLLMANLKGTNLEAASLEGANLFEAKLAKAKLRWANLIMAQLEGAELRGAELRLARLEDAQLEAAKFSEANLEEANLQGANLQGANFRGASLEKANLEEANLKGANLSKTNLCGTNLRRVNFYGTNLKNANLKKADLAGACLCKPELYLTARRDGNIRDFKKARLSEARLEGANIENIYFDDKTVWPIKDVVAQAKNIPIELQEQLGIILEVSQKSSSIQPSSKERQ